MLTCDEFNKLLGIWPDFQKLKDLSNISYGRSFYVFAKAILRSFYNMPLETQYAPVYIFVAALLRGGCRNPRNMNKDFLEILIQFSFIFNEEILSTISQEIKTELTSFTQETFKLLEGHEPVDKELRCLKRVFGLYVRGSSRPQPAPQNNVKERITVNLFYNTQNHEVIDAVSELLNIKDSEFIFKLAFHTLKAYLNEIIYSYRGLLTVLKKMSKYNYSLNTVHQATNYADIAEMHHLFSTFGMFHEGKSTRPYQLYMETGLINYKLTVKSLAQSSGKSWNGDLLILNYPLVVRFSANVLTGKNYSLFENHLKIFMERCKTRLLQEESIDTNFKKIAYAVPQALVDLTPIPKHYLELRESIFKNWIAILIYIGKTIQQKKSMDLLIQAFWLTALKKGILSD